MGAASCSWETPLLPPLPKNFSKAQVLYGDSAPSLVIPAQAGIQAAHPSSGHNHGPLDSRLRGNDEGQNTRRWVPGRKLTARRAASVSASGGGQTNLARKIFLPAAIALLALAGMNNAAAQTAGCGIPSPGAPIIQFNQFNIPPNLTEGMVITTVTQNYSITCPANSTAAGAQRGYYFVFQTNGTYGVTADPTIWKTNVAGIGVRVTNLTNGKILRWCPTQYLVTTDCQFTDPFITTQPFAQTIFSFTLQFEIIRLSGTIPTTNNVLGGGIIWLSTRGYSCTANTTTCYAGYNGTSLNGTVVLSTCTVITPSFTVGLPTLKVSDLSKLGDTGGNWDFSISLSCNGGKTIYVTLTDAANPSNTTNQLTLSSLSTARNVKLQIVKPDQTLVKFGPAAAVANNPGQWSIGSSGAPGTTGNARSIDLTAQYVSTGPVTPGTVNAAAIFTLAVLPIAQPFIRAPGSAAAVERQSGLRGNTGVTK